MKVNLVFIEDYANKKKGEKATFSRQLSSELIKLGVAKVDDVKPPQTKPEKPPQTKSTKPKK